MKRTNLFIIIFVIAVFCCSAWGNSKTLPNKINPSSHIDLSAPEKCVFYFYEAFRIGDAKILSQVLDEDAVLSEFNPDQKITRPNPEILGAKINKIEVIKKWHKGLDTSVELNDVMIYVTVKKDLKMITKKPGGVILDDNPCFWLRKIKGKWKILIVYPYCPEYENGK